MDSLEAGDVVEWAQSEIRCYEAYAEKGEILHLSALSCGQQASWIRRLLALATERLADTVVDVDILPFDGAEPGPELPSGRCWSGFLQDVPKGMGFEVSWDGEEWQPVEDVGARGKTWMLVREHPEPWTLEWPGGRGMADLVHNGVVVGRVFPNTDAQRIVAALNEKERGDG
jgi:hypothetical protein